MTIREFKDIFDSAHDDAEIKIENGEIIIIEPKPIEYKYKVDDRVLCSDGAKYKISGLAEVGGMPAYSVLGFDHLILSEAAIVELVPQDITERIKTFNDAFSWCYQNGKTTLTYEYDVITYSGKDVAPNLSPDILAYLKLRIIATALNEGWEPIPGKEEIRYYPYLCTGSDDLGVESETTVINFPRRLCFKSAKLAEYAAAQFQDIYADFCGCKKGGEK